MPITSSAKKALRQEKKRTIFNRRTKAKLKLALDAVKNSPTKKLISEAYQAIDRTAKKNLIHKNKAARLKSQVSKLTSKEATKSKSRLTRSKPAPKSKKPSPSKKSSK